MKLPTHIPNATFFQKLKTGRFFSWAQNQQNSRISHYIHPSLQFYINSQKKSNSTLEEKWLSLIKHSYCVYVERSKWYAFGCWQNVCRQYTLLISKLYFKEWHFCHRCCSSVFSVSGMVCNKWMFSPLLNKYIFPLNTCQLNSWKIPMRYFFKCSIRSLI